MTTKKHAVAEESPEPSKKPAGSRRARPAKPVGVVVLGMHRSGTSALTRTFNLLGARLPGDLLPPSVNNPLGHWEPRRVYQLHNELLEQQQDGWDSWTGIDPDWFHSPAAESFSEKLALFLTEEFSDTPLFVLKDPRICRLLPLWRDAFRMADMEIRVAQIFRNPLEVAASLARRNAMPPSKGQLVWLRHVLDAEASSRDLPRFTLSYAGLLADWRAVMKGAAQAWDLTWPNWTAEVEAEIDAFLDPDARHQVATDEPLTGRREASGFVAGAYDALRALAAGQGSVAVRMDEIRRGFDLTCDTFQSLVADLTVSAHAVHEEQRHKLKGAIALAARNAEALARAEAALAEERAQAEQAEQAHEAEREQLLEAMAASGRTIERMKMLITAQRRSLEIQGATLAEHAVAKDRQAQPLN